MRIAFVVNNYPPRMGGLESHVSSLARHLADQGHKVFVYTLSDTPGRHVEDGVTVTRYAEYFQVGDVLGFPRLGTSRRLRRALTADGIEIVSVHTRFFTMTWLGAIAARRLSIPLVHTEHGSGFVVSSSRLISFASRLVDLTFGRWALRSADLVLGVSENVLAFVKKLSGRTGELFYNAIEASPSPAIASGHSRASHLVFVGRIVPGKGWDTFVDAVAQLTAEGHHLTAEILGDGPDMGALRAKVLDVASPDLIRVRGRVTPIEVRESLRNATLVNPTVLSEGFQTTLLEALAESGRVVTYPVPGAAALVEQAAPVRITRQSTIEALHSELLRMLADPPPPAPNGFIDQWTWPERSKQFARVCQQLASGTKSRG